MKKTTKLAASVLAALGLLAGFVPLLSASADSLSTVSGSGETVLVSGATPSSKNKTVPSGIAAPSEIDTSVSERDASGKYNAEEAVYLSAEDDLTITHAGVYVLTGNYTDKMIVVDAAKEDKVQIVLENAVLSNKNGPAVYIRSADKVFLTAADGTENTISDGSGYTLSDGETTLDAAVFSKEDLTVNGSGKLTVTGNTKHAIVSKDDLVITAKNLTVTAVNSCLYGKDSVKVSDAVVLAAAGTDGIHSDEFVVITGGTVSLKASEGIEAAYILITGGEIGIQASDDGINAARKSATYTPTVEITGGTVTVTMGNGDTDGIDSNGNLIISGGTVYVNANSPFDYDGSASFTGGTVYVNGTQVTSLPSQMMGGFGGRGSFREGMGNQGGFGSSNGEQGSSENQEGFGTFPGEQGGFRRGPGKHL